MKLINFFKGVIIITILALAYIHLQMKIYDLAYVAQEKEKNVRTMLEKNGDVTHNILMMKSASHLGDQILGKKKGMQFADSQDVLEVALPHTRHKEAAYMAPDAANNRIALRILLPFGATAEANNR